MFDAVHCWLPSNSAATRHQLCQWSALPARLQVCCADRYCMSNTDKVANTLCKQLGLPTPGRLVGTDAYGPGTGPVHMDRIVCPNSQDAGLDG